MRRILIDTNAYAAFKRGDTRTRDILRHAPEIALNATVMGKLLAGFAVEKCKRGQRFAL